MNTSKSHPILWVTALKKIYTKLNACTAFLCEQETDAYAKSHPTPGEPWASFSRRESNSHNDSSSNKV